ncbi:hypothetical protein A0128_19975 [Leptospira tipperaryensis]|uniref:Uncharacterized protein n=1 Tax=Leptospira tipperaryensis TaxID=2564040 RepID=A0A1D7V388_9LEPT|nr:hypothetical protein A0128_19975 [Leptospira tipperaryensis]
MSYFRGSSRLHPRFGEKQTNSLIQYFEYINRKPKSVDSNKIFQRKIFHRSDRKERPTFANVKNFEFKRRIRFLPKPFGFSFCL